MRFIYMDEAGISAPEKATVVAGVVVHADRQWIPTVRAIAETESDVPENLREGFIFHATKIWNSQKYRNGWTEEQRLAFLLKVMAIPRKMRLGIVWGVEKRSDPNVIETSARADLAKEKVQHFRAFANCLACADEYIRERCTGEIAVAVAEDNFEMRKELREAMAYVRAGRFSVTSLPLDKPLDSDESRALSKRRELRLTRVVDKLHFAAKNEAPLLVLADACAFGVRRYVLGLKYGADMAAAVFGDYLKETGLDKSAPTHWGWHVPAPPPGASAWTISASFSVPS